MNAMNAMNAMTAQGFKNALAAVAVACAALGGSGAQAQGVDDCMLGDIRLFAGNFAPVGWLRANGQLLSISEYEILFVIFGTTYGGDGQTNFALPNLSSRVPVGTGQGPGRLQTVQEGMQFGAEAVRLQSQQMPAHNHALVVAAGATTAVPTAGAALAPVDNGGAYAVAATNTILGPGTVGVTGGNQPLALAPPALGLHYIMCVQGIFPSRP